jgi:hypothetical protein
MTCAYPSWELATDAHLIKLQRLQNKVFRTIGNFPRRTPVREKHMAGNKQKSFQITTIKMFSILEKAKPDVESIRVLPKEYDFEAVCTIKFRKQTS